MKNALNTFFQKSYYDKYSRQQKSCEIQTDKITTSINKTVEEKNIKLNKKLISSNIKK